MTKKIPDFPKYSNVLQFPTVKEADILRQEMSGMEDAIKERLDKLDNPKFLLATFPSRINEKYKLPRGDSHTLFSLPLPADCLSAIITE